MNSFIVWPVTCGRSPFQNNPVPFSNTCISHLPPTNDKMAEMVKAQRSKPLLIDHISTGTMLRSTRSRSSGSHLHTKPLNDTLKVSQKVTRHHALVGIDPDSKVPSLPLVSAMKITEDKAKKRIYASNETVTEIKDIKVLIESLFERISSLKKTITCQKEEIICLKKSPATGKHYVDQ